MAAFRKDLTDLIRPNLAGGKFSPELVGGIDDILDRAGVPRDDGGALATPKAKPPLPPFRKAFTDLCRPHLSGGKFSLDLVAAIDAALDRAGVPRDAGAGAPSSPPPVAEATIPKGRPTILFERHKFAANTVPKGRFNAAHPAISGGPYGSGGYGKFSAQYGKLLDACALDPEAALRACSWGAFQVLGENAVPIGYRSTLEMVLSLTTGEQAHLESFVRFVRGNHLADELRACRAGDPASCVPFVKAYNGSDFAVNAYHKKLAAALR